MKGIEQLKDVTFCAISFGNVLGKTLEDGKISLSELTEFIDPVSKLPAAISGIGEVPSELSDLDEAEKQELFQAVQEEFDIPEEKVEKTILRSLQFAVELQGFISDIQAIYKTE